MRVVILFLLMVLSITPAGAWAQAGGVVPLPQAHAHNDYQHPRPLIDALDHGFCSVEADIFLVDGELLVGHDRSELRAGRTLQSLYLDPLRERVKQNGGRVFPGGPTLMLLVDIKADGEQVYAVLDEVLTSYKDMVSAVHDGRFEPGAVQVVISGDRPVDAIAADATRYVGIDGRLTDLNSTEPADLMPLISDRWTSHFQWKGVDEFPADQRDKLRSIVGTAHRAGRRVRFWATPETPLLWKELRDARADHINTDKLAQLQEFLLNR